MSGLPRNEKKHLKETTNSQRVPVLPGCLPYHNTMGSCPLIPPLKLICSSRNKTADAMMSKDSYRTVCRVL